MAILVRLLLYLGGILSSFGRYFLPLLATIWPRLLALIGWIFSSWTRVLAFIVTPLQLGACEAGLYKGAWATFSDTLLGMRTFLFAKITEPFPTWIQQLGAFVNSAYPLDTLFTAFGLVITIELALITLGIAGKVLRKMISLSGN